MRGIFMGKDKELIELCGLRDDASFVYITELIFQRHDTIRKLLES